MRRRIVMLVLLLTGGVIVHVLVAFATEAITSQQANRILATRVEPAGAYPVETLSDDDINAFDWIEYGSPLPAVKKRLAFGESRAEFVRAVVIPGFIINTLFYATVTWVLFVGSVEVRCALRRKRRLCEKCAYPIGASRVCTECGAAVAPASHTESPPRFPRSPR